MTKKKNLLRPSEFAKAINVKPPYVSALIAEPKIKVTVIDNIKYIDTEKYPIKDWKKQGT